MRLPSRVGQLQHVKDGGLHVVELVFATWGCDDRKNQL